MTLVDYAELEKTILALTEGEVDAVALMATLACEIHHADERFDWTGFYRVVAPELLKIGPYQGGHGCLVIPFARGVCGAAARTGEVQLVDDVDAFPGHIACASSTRSEIVLPVRNGAGEAGWRGEGAAGRSGTGSVAPHHPASESRQAWPKASSFGRLVAALR